jgi:hypothetical protein
MSEDKSSGAKKAVAVILIIAAIGGGIWYYLHTKKEKDVNPAPAPAPDPVVEEKAIEENLESKTFDEMSKVLEADPVWSNHVFPADFYPAVKTDYDNIKAGNPRAPNYNYGKPGAFMSVVDAWKDAMGIAPATHEQLWKVYSAYISEDTKSKM